MITLLVIVLAAVIGPLAASGSRDLRGLFSVLGKSCVEESRRQVHGMPPSNELSGGPVTIHPEESSP